MTQAPSTTPSTRPLSEVARHVVYPEGIVSTGWAAVEKKCAEWGDGFDEWQRGAGRVMLGRREDGIYASTIGGITLSIPRQVAKTFLVMRIVFALCALFPGLKVLWTAHRTRTATNTFKSLQGFAKRKKVAPYIENIRTANGEQEIVFRNGSVIMFGAREQGFGRGFDEVDIEVFDEAQILTEKALEDMVAATNQSRHQHGALLFYMGTPPRPGIDPGEAFTARRAEALSGKSEDAVYIECSADPDADPDDRKQWAKANPSYPHRTPLRSMLRLRKNLPSDDAWRREALGIWAARAGAAISPKAWEDTGVADPPGDGIKSFGIAFSFDGRRVAVAGALKHAGGLHVELIGANTGQLEAGVAELAQWLSDRWREAATIVISGKAGANVLATNLHALGVPNKAIHVATSTEYFTSCAMFADAVRDGAVTHLATEGQSVLDASVAACDKKLRGLDGAWAWTTTEPGGDETPLEAVSLAHWGAKTTKRRPGRTTRGTVLA